MRHGDGGSPGAPRWHVLVESPPVGHGRQAVPCHAKPQREPGSASRGGSRVALFDATTASERASNLLAPYPLLESLGSPATMSLAVSGWSQR